MAHTKYTYRTSKKSRCKKELVDVFTVKNVLQ